MRTLSDCARLLREQGCYGFEIWDFTGQINVKSSPMYEVKGTLSFRDQAGELRYAEFGIVGDEPNSLYYDKVDNIAFWRDYLLEWIEIKQP